MTTRKINPEPRCFDGPNSIFFAERHEHHYHYHYHYHCRIFLLIILAINHTMEINPQQTPQLPRELLKLIFSFCEDSTLAAAIPRVSKLFKELSDDNSDVWKQKCTEKYSTEEIKNLKNQQTSWKQLGFVSTFHLFMYIRSIFIQFILQSGGFYFRLATDGVLANSLGLRLVLYLTRAIIMMKTITNFLT